MKRRILLSILILLVINVSAQYNPQLIDTTKHWSIADQPCPGCGGILYSYYIKFQGDTLINSTVYTKVLKSYDEFMEDWELYALIREEDNKYYLRNLVNEEGLIYDFNVNTGDTVTINNPFGFMPLEASIINIDSVFIEPANEYRKRIILFEYENFGSEEIWIEGIGSLAGITESGWDISVLTGGHDYTLLCYYEEEELMYKDYLFLTCFYPIVGIHSHNHIEMNVSIAPNPVTDISYIKLENPCSEKLTIKIFNANGYLVKNHQIESSTKYKIDASTYSKGVYFYQVIKENQQIFNSKFIVL